MQTVRIQNSCKYDSILRVGGHKLIERCLYHVSRLPLVLLAHPHRRLAKLSSPPVRGVNPNKVAEAGAHEGPGALEKRIKRLVFKKFSAKTLKLAKDQAPREKMILEIAGEERIFFVQISKKKNHLVPMLLLAPHELCKSARDKSSAKA